MSNRRKGKRRRVPAAVAFAADPELEEFAFAVATAPEDEFTEDERALRPRTRAYFGLPADYGSRSPDAGPDAGR